MQSEPGCDAQLAGTQSGTREFVREMFGEANCTKGNCSDTMQNYKFLRTAVMLCDTLVKVKK